LGRCRRSVRGDRLHSGRLHSGRLQVQALLPVNLFLATQVFGKEAWCALCQQNQTSLKLTCYYLDTCLNHRFYVWKLRQAACGAYQKQTYC
jgi:hypothetical protein